MNLDDAQLAPVAGSDGLACRFPGVVLFCGSRRPPDAVGDLIGRCRRAAESPLPGATLARQLAGLLATADAGAIPPFAMAAQAPGGVVVLVHGSVDVSVAGAEGDHTISGASSITWVDRLLQGDQTTILMQLTGSVLDEAGAEADLIAGTVPASGLLLRSRGSQGSAPSVAEVGAPPPGPPIRAEGDRSPEGASGADGGAGGGVRSGSRTGATIGVPLDEPSDASPPGSDGPTDPDAHFEPMSLEPDEDDEQREPLPVEPDAADVRDPEGSARQEVVEGVVCSRGHFNDPRSRYCSSCGISMVHLTQNLVPGPRPPLGVLVFEDGTTYSLSSSYVIGRQPDIDPRVVRGEVLPLVLEDDDRTVSRVHAELRLRDWDVHFVNLSTTNGSFVWDPPSGQWVPVSDQPVVLAPGARVAMGHRVAVFESPLVR